MVNRERADEMVAKGVVESVLGVALAYADVNDGDVDYRSADGLVAVEVTRVTNGERKAARDALSTSVRGHEKVPTGGQVAVPSGGQRKSPLFVVS